MGSKGVPVCVCVCACVYIYFKEMAHVIVEFGNYLQGIVQQSGAPGRSCFSPKAEFLLPRGRSLFVPPLSLLLIS